MSDAFKLQSSIELNSKDVLEKLKKIDGQFENTSDSVEKAESKFTKFSKGLSSISTKISNFGSKLGDVGKSLSTKVTLPIVALGTASVKFASDLNESLNKVEVAFGNNANEVTAWSDTTLEKFGIAKGTALDMASTFGDMGTSMGLTTGEASSMATSLSGLAGDLSSFKNIGIDQAVTALNGVFTGETESLKTLGIVMTQTNLDAYALANGFSKTTSEMTEAEKVNLRYSYVMDKTKNAQGDFARTSDGTANSLRVFKESLKELGATFGQNILPVITPIVQKFSELAKRFGDLSPSVQKTILVITGLIGAIGPLLVIGGSIASGIGSLLALFGTISGAIAVVTTGAVAATPAIGALATVFTVLTGPVGLVIAIVAGLIAIGVALWKNWDTIKEKAGQLGNWLGEKWQGIKDKTSETWTNMKEKTSEVFSSMKSKIEEHGGGIKGFISASAEANKQAWNNALSQMDEWTGGKFSGIKSKIESNGGGIKGTLITLTEGYKNIWSSAFSKLDDVTGGKLSSIKNSISNGLNIIKGFFSNLRLPEIKIPYIKLPHFNLSGSFSLKPPSVPRLNVDWYSEGAIFTKKTVLPNGVGVGDANKGQGNNAEAVIPLDILLDKFDKVANRPINVYITARELARETASEMKNELNKLELKNVRFGY